MTRGVTTSEGPTHGTAVQISPEKPALAKSPPLELFQLLSATCLRALARLCHPAAGSVMPTLHVRCKLRQLKSPVPGHRAQAAALR